MYRFYVLFTEMAFDGLRPVPVMKQVIKTIKTNLVIDGGNVMKCDDVIVMTDKVFRGTFRYKAINLL